VLAEINALRSATDRDADQLEILSGLEHYIRMQVAAHADEKPR